MSEYKFIVRFDDATAKDADMYANSLSETLLRAVGPVEVERRRESDETQDFGIILSIVLGSTAVTAVATGIKAWLSRHNTAKLSVWTPQGQLIAKDLDSKDVAAIVDALRRPAQ